MSKPTAVPAGYLAGMLDGGMAVSSNLTTGALLVDQAGSDPAGMAILASGAGAGQLPATAGCKLVVFTSDGSAQIATGGNNTIFFAANASGSVSIPCNNAAAFTIQSSPGGNVGYLILG